MFIALHNLATRHTNLLTSIRIARETGYAGIEIGNDKLQSYLGQGVTVDALRRFRDDVPPVGFSYVQDVERQEQRDYESLLQECEERCATAEAIGCPMV